MKHIFGLITAVALTFSSLSNASDMQVARLILNDSKIISAVDLKIKQILPRLKMKFSGIQVEASQTNYAAVMTYTDTAKDTFFNPSFGDCSVLARGRIIGGNSLTLDSVVEYDCGE